MSPKSCTLRSLSDVKRSRHFVSILLSWRESRCSFKRRKCWLMVRRWWAKQKNWWIRHQAHPRAVMSLHTRQWPRQVTSKSIRCCALHSPSHHRRQTPYRHSARLIGARPIWMIKPWAKCTTMSPITNPTSSIDPLHHTIPSSAIKCAPSSRNQKTWKSTVPSAIAALQLWAVTRDTCAWFTINCARWTVTFVAMHFTSDQIWKSMSKGNTSAH